MTPRQFLDGGEIPDDKRLSRMVALSAVMHIVTIVAIMLSATRGNRAVLALPTAYTVSLVDPAALGTNLSGGAGGEKPAAPRPQPTAEAKPPPVAKKEEPKVETPPQPKEAPKPEAKKEEPKKPSPPPPETKETAKLPDKTKPAEQPPKPEAKKPEVKPEPPQTTTKDTKLLETKPEPPRTAVKPDEKKPEPPKTETSAQSPEDRDKQIQEALNRIKTKVEKEAPGPGAGNGASSTTVASSGGPGAGIKGSGPATLGGAPGAGGGGVVRGLEYIMYTEQVKRRVKENWIVAERRDGLNAIVRFNVQPGGEISALEMMKSSGDSAFDQSVLRAVNKANPLPPPPEAYREEFVSQKVEVTFRSEERTN